MLVVIVLGVNAAAFVSMQARLNDISSTKRGGPVWIAVQTQFEVLRFERALALFMAKDPHISAKDVRFRFNILWSRVAIALVGQDGRPAAAGSSSEEVIKELSATLHRQDAFVSALRDGDVASAHSIYSAFSPYGPMLIDYSLAAKNQQAALDSASRKYLLSMSKAMVGLTFAVSIALLLLAALFFLDAREQRKTSAEMSRLLAETKVAYTTKSLFISTVSHELRTPLTSIMGALGLIRSGKLWDVPIKLSGIIESAYINCGRLNSLINDILDFEKLEANAMTFDLQLTDLGSLVSSVVASVREYKKEKSVVIVTKGVEMPCLVCADSNRLSQVLSNILSNAIKFSAQGGEISVSMKKVQGRAVISIADAGEGIPIDFQPMVFERFTQADSSDARKASGTGLGMSIAKSIMERLGGKIYFESEVGVGTTFFIELDVAESPTTDGAGQFAVNSSG